MMNQAAADEDPLCFIEITLEESNNPKMVTAGINWSPSLGEYFDMER
jgi:hypothetical protein